MFSERFRGSMDFLYRLGRSTRDGVSLKGLWTRLWCVVTSLVCGAGGGEGRPSAPFQGQRQPGLLTQGLAPPWFLGHSGQM